MTQSPTATAIAAALDELALYEDTDEAEVGRELARVLLDLVDENAPARTLTI